MLLTGLVYTAAVVGPCMLQPPESADKHQTQKFTSETSETDGSKGGTEAQPSFLTYGLGLCLWMLRGGVVGKTLSGTGLPAPAETSCFLLYPGSAI